MAGDPELTVGTRRNRLILAIRDSETGEGLAVQQLDFTREEAMELAERVRRQALDLPRGEP